MPYDPHKNKWFGTTSRLNRDKMWAEKNSDNMSDDELLADAKKKQKKMRPLRRGAARFGRG